MKTLKKITIVLTVIALGMIIYVNFLSGDKEKTGSFETDKKGGEYCSKEICFYISENKKETSTFEVFKKTANVSKYSKLKYRSKFAYQISGHIKSYSGKLKVEFKFPEKFKNFTQEELNENLLITTEYPIYDISLKKHQIANDFIKPKIDFKNKKISASIHFDTFMKRFKQININSLFSDNNNYYELAFHLIILDKKVKRLSLKKTKNQKFIIIGNSDISNIEIDNIFSILEHQKKLLQNLRFDFSLLPKNLKIRLCNDENITCRFVGVKGFLNKSWIEINPNILANKKDANMFIGKALLNWLQTTNSGEIFNWFDIAVSNWYAPISRGEKFYVPIGITENLNSFISTFSNINNPNFNESYTESNFGNNSSLLVGFQCSNKNNVFYISDLYKTFLKEKNRNKIYLVDSIFSVERKYPQFLNAILRKSNSIFLGIDDYEKIPQQFSWKKINTTIEKNNNKWSLNWNLDNFKENKIQNNKAEISLNLNKLSTKFIQVIFNIEDEKIASEHNFCNKEFSLKLNADSCIKILPYIKVKDKLILAKDENSLITHKNNKLIIKYFPNLFLAICNTKKSKNKAKISFTYFNTGIDTSNKNTENKALAFVDKWQGVFTVDDYLTRKELDKVAVKLQVFEIEKKNKSSLEEGICKAKMELKRQDTTIVHVFDIKYKGDPQSGYKLETNQENDDGSFILEAYWTAKATDKWGNSYKDIFNINTLSLDKLNSERVYSGDLKRIKNKKEKPKS